MEECEEALEPSVMGRVAGGSRSGGTWLSRCSILLFIHQAGETTQ